MNSFKCVISFYFWFLCEVMIKKYPLALLYNLDITVVLAQFSIINKKTDTVDLFMKLKKKHYVAFFGGSYAVYECSSGH